MTFALIYSNWAFRSGCFEPSFALRLDWRENPSFTNSLRTVSALIGCPISVRAAASFSMLFDTQIKGRMGSPSVAGSTSRWSAGSSPGSFSETARRPPPARRTCPFGNGSAPRSALPRLSVERVSPVSFDTRARPPHPAVRTSTAANNRCPRSSSFEPTASQRCRMASSSIMRPIYACSPRTGIPKTRVTPPHDARLRFSYCSRRPKLGTHAQSRGTRRAVRRCPWEGGRELRPSFPPIAHETKDGNVMGFFSQDIKNMDDLFMHPLRDIYYAEKQIVQALPEMIEKSTDAQLKQGFQSHLREK